MTKQRDARPNPMFLDARVDDMFRVTVDDLDTDYWSDPFYALRPRMNLLAHANDANG